MKLIDFLHNIGNPIPYYPNLNKITGSANSTILFCYLNDQADKQADSDGCIYPKIEKLAEETGLSYEELYIARVNLIVRGLIKVTYNNTAYKITANSLDIPKDTDETNKKIYNLEDNPEHLVFIQIPKKKNNK